MKTTKELLQLMLKNIELISHYGLCHLLHKMEEKRIISYAEHDNIYDYMFDHRPFWVLNMYSFWFPSGWKFPRKMWLKYQIWKLS